MGFKTDRMSAQDRILSKFDKILKSEKYNEKQNLKEQLEQLEKEKNTPKPKQEEQPMYIPTFAVKYKMEENELKKQKNKK
jgi:hypothetical protein